MNNKSFIGLYYVSCSSYIDVNSNSNVEDISINEHKVVYDIFFRSRLPNNSKIGILIDLESQSNIDTNYHLINRAQSYASHLFASQLKKEYLYKDLDKVYSIWICSNRKANSKTDIFIYSTNRQSIFNTNSIDEDYKLVNIVIIYLGKDIDEIINTRQHDSYIHLLKLLRLLITRNNKNTEEQEKILKNDYNIIINKEDIKNMCNFSEAFEYECREEYLGQGINIGKDIGIKQGIIENTANNINKLIHSLNITYEQAVNILDIDESIRNDVLIIYNKQYRS